MRTRKTPFIRYFLVRGVNLSWSEWGADQPVGNTASACSDQGYTGLSRGLG